MSLEKNWRSILLQFVQKSPPIWPGQAAFLEENGITISSPASGLSPVNIEVDKELVVKLCTEYFCSGFVKSCTEAKMAGHSNGEIGLNALTQAVENVFEERGVNRFFQVISKFWSDYLDITFE